MPFLYKLLVTAVVCVLALGCVENEGEQQPGEASLPKDFNDFYVRFHRDTAFQMERISWPLSGIKAGGRPDSAAQWTRRDWQPHTQIPSSLEYDQTFSVLSDDLVVETIRDKGHNYAMQRRFARMADGWTLIYYVEMQSSRPD